MKVKSDKAITSDFVATEVRLKYSVIYIVFIPTHLLWYTFVSAVYSRLNNFKTVINITPNELAIKLIDLQIKFTI